MPLRQTVRKGVPLPVLGLDVSKPAEFADPRSSPDCLNMELYRTTIRKRLGTVALGASLGERVMAFGQLQIASTIYVVRVGATKVELLNQNAGTWSTIASAPLTGTTGDRFCFAFPLLSAAKIMTFTNGVDPIRKYTGTGNDAALGGSPPKCKFMIAYRGYLVLAYIVDGGNTYTMRAQWCDTGAPEVWTGGNAGTIDLLEDEEDITGIGVFGDFITIHKDNSIYVGSLVTTSDIFRFDRKGTGVGAVANDTIKSIPTGEQIFLARDGLHLFNGITAPLIPSPVMDEMREQMNPQYVNKSWGVVVRELDEYWVGVPLGSDVEPTTVYKYNYRTGQVYKDSRSNVCAVSTYITSSQLTWNDKSGQWNSDTTEWNDVIYSALNPTLIFGETGGITTQRNPIYSDNAAAINSFWVSKDFTIADIAQDEMGRLIRWTGIQVWAKGDSVKLEYSTDQGLNWTVIPDLDGNLTFALASAYPTDASPLFGYFDVVTSQIRFRFSNSIITSSFTLEKFILYGVPREERE